MHYKVAAQKFQNTQTKVNCLKAQLAKDPSDPKLAKDLTNARREMQKSLRNFLSA